MEQSTHERRRYLNDKPIKLRVLGDDAREHGRLTRWAAPADFPDPNYAGRVWICRFPSGFDPDVHTEWLFWLRRGRNVIHAEPDRELNSELPWRTHITVSDPSDFEATGGMDEEGRPLYRLTNYGMIVVPDFWTDSFDPQEVSPENPVFVVMTKGLYAIVTRRAEFIELMARMATDGRLPDLTLLREGGLVMKILRYDVLRCGRPDPQPDNPKHRVYEEVVTPAQILNLSCEIPDEDEILEKERLYRERMEAQWGEDALARYITEGIVREDSARMMREFRNHNLAKLPQAVALTQMIVAQHRRHVAAGLGRPDLDDELSRLLEAERTGEPMALPPALAARTQAKLTIRDMERLWVAECCELFGDEIGIPQATRMGQLLLSASGSVNEEGPYPPNELDTEIDGVINLFTAAQLAPQFRIPLLRHLRVKYQGRNPAHYEIAAVRPTVTSGEAAEPVATPTVEETPEAPANADAPVSFLEPEVIAAQPTATPPPSAPTLEQRWDHWRVEQGIGKAHLPRLMSIAASPEEARQLLLAYNAEEVEDPLAHLESNFRSRVAERLLK